MHAHMYVHIRSQIREHEHVQRGFHLRMCICMPGPLSGSLATRNPMLSICGMRALSLCPAAPRPLSHCLVFSLTPSLAPAPHTCTRIGSAAGQSAPSAANVMGVCMILQPLARAAAQTATLLASMSVLSITPLTASCSLPPSAQNSF